MTNDNLLSGKEAQDKLIAGADKVADAVKGTLGSAGYNALLEHHLYPFSETTNDGVSIARAIELSDPYERLGANLMKEIASRADKQSGDGTTTAITLAQAIIHEGKDATVPPMQLKRELEECVALIEDSLNTQKREITVDDVATVATISAEDPTIGATIQEIYQQIGKDGILFRDISKTFSDHYTLGKGIQISDAGFSSPYMADIGDNGQFLPIASFKNPKILVTKQKITSPDDLNNLAVSLYGQETKELIVFYDDMEATLVPSLVMTRAEKGFRFLMVKMPVLWKDWWFEDLAKITGATVVDPAAGLTFKTMNLTHLGTCGSILVDKSDTYLDGIQDISAHLATLEADGSDDARLRIARLNKKTARYYVGAPTDQALSYRKMKVEDAVGATWQALHGGIVPGGGVALLNASKVMPDTVGGRILSIALSVPIQQIIENAGGKDDDSIITGTLGFDARSGQVVDMWTSGIVDPTNVVLNSARNAISTAAAVLTCRVIVALPPRNAPSQANMPVL